MKQKNDLQYCFKCQMWSELSGSRQSAHFFGTDEIARRKGFHLRENELRMIKLTRSAWLGAADSSTGELTRLIGKETAGLRATRSAITVAATRQMKFTLKEWRSKTSHRL